ncbi:3-oxoacyl-ACP synthase, partial [Dolichospermum sp. ST_con]|nr:3-oxoacyl-ACP synthase [Dolichospermum sp. ST_con]
MQNFFNSGIAITGSGSAVPATCLHNQKLTQLVETSDEWIASRTGIRERRLALPPDSLASLATAASKQAIDAAGITAADIDLILLATSTPDDLFGTACRV